MRLGSIRLDNTCYKCTNDREIVICMIKKSEYRKIEVKRHMKNAKIQIYRIDIYEMIYMYCKERNMRIVI